jgi:deoxyribonuclease IV
MPMAGGMVKAIDRAVAIGASTMQIFTDNPAAWKRRDEPPAELHDFRVRLAASGIGPLSIHAPYLVNLAGSDPLSHGRSVSLVAHELRGASTFGARFVNVHIGSHTGHGVTAGIARLTSGVHEAITSADLAEHDDTMLVLENSAGGGGGLGTGVEELARIAASIAAAGIPDHRIGFCLDTAHAWGAGLDMSDPSAIDDLLGDFATEIGLSRLVMVHLNDSRSERGSRVDRHEHLAAGRIGAAGLAHVLRHPGLRHAAYVLETPGMDEGYDAINLDRARTLAAGLPLPDLPPAAFELVGSARARTAPA